MKATCVMSLAAFSITALATLPPGYTEVPLEWEFDGPEGKVTFAGTIEQAEAQFHDKFPDTPLVKRDASNDLISRQEEDGSWAGASYECIQTQHEVFDWKPADAGRVREGWNYLYTLSHTPKFPAGPGNCGRISCSYQAGIYLCNDNDHEIEVESWAHIAGGALELCTLCSAAGQRDVCGGQMFHEDNYNVLIAEDLTC